ncbi:MAG: hypothetical protein JNM88_12975 [Chitinophagaceae bacterium]|nr:hypothetical protein [Chitinophagaceae bacterium]
MKYLNGVLTLIAACLVLITFAVTGIIPSANAKGTDKKFVTVPLNADGTITVRMAPNSVTDINIKEVGGRSCYGELDVNIEEVDGNSFYNAVPVKIRD